MRLDERLAHWRALASDDRARELPASWRGRQTANTVLRREMSEVPTPGRLLLLESMRRPYYRYRLARPCGERSSRGSTSKGGKGAQRYPQTALSYCIGR